VVAQVSTPRMPRSNSEVFDRLGALNKLEAFSSFHGADFYGLPRNKTKITLERNPWQVPESFSFGTDTIVPFRAGGQVGFQMVDGSAIPREVDL
jgi:dihydroorotase